MRWIRLPASVALALVGLWFAVLGFINTVYVAFNPWADSVSPRKEYEVLVLALVVCGAETLLGLALISAGVWAAKPALGRRTPPSSAP